MSAGNVKGAGRGEGAGCGEGVASTGHGEGAASAGYGEDAESAGHGERAGVASVGSGEDAAIEIGRNEVWKTIFVGDETIKYVDSSFCRKDHRILCSFEGAGVRDVEGRVNDIVSGHGRKKLVVVHRGANDVGKVYLEVLTNRHRILGKRLKTKGCEVMISDILPRFFFVYCYEFWPGRRAIGRSH